MYIGCYTRPCTSIFARVSTRTFSSLVPQLHSHETFTLPVLLFGTCFVIFQMYTTVYLVYMGVFSLVGNDREVAECCSVEIYMSKYTGMYLDHISLCLMVLALIYS